MLPLGTFKSPVMANTCKADTCKADNCKAPSGQCRLDCDWWSVEDTQQSTKQFTNDLTGCTGEWTVPGAVTLGTNLRDVVSSTGYLIQLTEPDLTYKTVTPGTRIVYPNAGTSSLVSSRVIGSRNVKTGTVSTSLWHAVPSTTTTTYQFYCGDQRLLMVGASGTYIRGSIYFQRCM